MSVFWLHRHTKMLVSMSQIIRVQALGWSGRDVNTMLLTVSMLLFRHLFPAYPLVFDYFSGRTLSLTTHTRTVFFHWWTVRLGQHLCHILPGYFMFGFFLCTLSASRPHPDPSLHSGKVACKFHSAMTQKKLITDTDTAYTWKASISWC